MLRPIQCKTMHKTVRAGRHCSYIVSYHCASWHGRCFSPASYTAKRCTMVEAASQQSPSSVKSTMKVAVVGAGAAGLAAARELLKEGHSVQVLEKAPRAGGVWVLDPEVEDDPLGQAPSRTVVHSSMYNSLRTNLPREVMGYQDLPFTPEFMQGRSVDDRRFCSHEEVLLYLETYAERFQLHSVVQYDTTVTRVCKSEQSTSTARWQSPKWDVTFEPTALRSPAASQPQTEESRNGGGRPVTQTFDAVVVCNGHYSAPRLPPVLGIAEFPGLCMHSHNYRTPEPFEGLKVLIVGAHASGEDIARDVAEAAAEVIISAKHWMVDEWAHDERPFGPRENITRRAWLSELTDAGTAVLDDGSAVEGVDVVMFCTGYKYEFPFLEDGIVDSSRSHVRPLYKHIVPPAYAPTLSFLGLPFKVVPCPLVEMQAKMIARLLSGSSQLPPRAEMEHWAERHYRSFEEAGVPDRHVHQLGQAQWEYLDWMASVCGPDVPRVPEWRKTMNAEASRLRRLYAADYRNHWLDEQSVRDAYAEFDAQRRRTDSKQVARAV